MNTRVLIVEDHELLAQSLSFALRADGIAVEVAVDLDPERVLAAAARFSPTVVLLDFHLGECVTSVPLIAPLRARGAAVVMVTGEADPVRLAECLEAGATGVVSKADPFDHLVAAVKQAAATGRVMPDPQRQDLLAALWRWREEEEQRQAPFTLLTAREQAVLAALMDGKTAEVIAAESFVSVSTVRSHIRAVLIKLGVNSQLAAVSKTRQAGWSLSA